MGAWRGVEPVRKTCGEKFIPRDLSLEGLFDLRCVVGISGKFRPGKPALLDPPSDAHEGHAAYASRALVPAQEQDRQFEGGHRSEIFVFQQFRDRPPVNGGPSEDRMS